MRKKAIVFLICAAIVLTFSPAAAAGEDSGFFNMGEAPGVGIRALTAAGETARGFRRDADGDGAADVFYPGSVALAVTLGETARGEMYILTLSSSEKILYADQQTGGGELEFSVKFTLPESPAELVLNIGSTAAGFEKIAVTLFYTPSAPPADTEPEPVYVPVPLPEPAEPPYAACERGEECPLAAFSDLNVNAWYHDGVHWALENGVMAGYGGGKFLPGGTARRAMIVTMLHRMEGRPIVVYDMDFSDVEEGKWYTEAIRWAAANNIVSGYGNGRFGPNDSISREQLALILWRYARHKGRVRPLSESPGLGAFSDAGSVSEWAAEALEWAVGTGLITGMGNGRLSPLSAAGRAQVAAVLMRYSLMQ